MPSEYSGWTPLGKKSLQSELCCPSKDKIDKNSLKCSHKINPKIIQHDNYSLHKKHFHSKCSHKSQSAQKQLYEYSLKQHRNLHDQKNTMKNCKIEEEYKLRKLSDNLGSNEICPYSISKCKYINHFLSKISNKLKEEKHKNKVLKRRNLELSKQNEAFNDYFQIFETKYQHELQKRKVISTRKSSVSQSKSQRNSDLYYSFKPFHKDHKSKHNSSNNKIAGSTADEIDQYSHQGFSGQKSLSLKKNSFVTNSSSRKRSGENMCASKFRDVISYH